jgi:preprotein translocase subunit SecA/Fe-S-cluster containining protein
MIKMFWKWFFGTKQKRDLKRMWPLVEDINDHFAELVEQCGLSGRVPEKGSSFPEMTATEKARVDEIAQPKAAELRRRAREDGESLDDLLVETFALVKLACWRMVGERWHAGGNEVIWDMVPFDVQLLGGVALHRGNIAEMSTGEGKTLVAILPLSLNGLSGKGAHLVTVNDYLAKRDSEWMGPVYEYLGLTVGCVDKSEPHTPERRAAYRCDITYGTNNEFGFDYLRDNMVHDKEQLVQREQCFAIVDEVDSILIDEARTPLIISGPVDRSTHQYDRLVPYVRELVNKQMYLVNRLASEAEALLREAPDSYEAGIKLVQCMKGAPKNKRYMKLRSEPAFQRLQETVELEFMRDKRMPELESELYFSVDERGFSVALTDKGRETLSPDNPTHWVLPDIVEETSEIEGCTEITEVDRDKLHAVELLPDVELKRRKIKVCAALAPEERVELIRAVSCPGLDETTRQAAIERVRSSVHKRMDFAIREIDGLMKSAPDDAARLGKLAHWQRWKDLLGRLRIAGGIEESRRRSLLHRLLSLTEGLALLQGDVMTQIEEELAAASASAPASAPCLLDEERLEQTIRQSPLPEDVQLEAIRILRWPAHESEERHELLERLAERFQKRIEYQRGLIEKVDALPPPPPPPPEDQEPPPPPPPPEKILEQQIKDCEPLSPPERDEMLRIIRRGKEELEARIAQLQPIKEKAKQRLSDLVAAGTPVLHLRKAPEGQATPSEDNPLKEELLVVRLLASEVLLPSEIRDMILATWEPNLLAAERTTRIEQSLESARKRYRAIYESAVQAISIGEKDREVLGGSEIVALLDEELIARKLLMASMLTSEERQNLLREYWMPGTTEEKRRARIEHALEGIRARLKSEGGGTDAEAQAQLDSLFALTEEDRRRLPQIKEPLPDERLIERKIKLCSALTPDECLGLLQTVHCPGLDDEVRQVFFRRILEKAKSRESDPEALRSIENCILLTEEDRIELSNIVPPLLEQEYIERKIMQCPFLSEEETVAMLKAIYAPELPDEQRQLVLRQAKEHAKNRRRAHFDAKAEELHNISQILVAFMLKEKDVDYVVEDNKVIIVDEFTGRKMPGRRWSDGLHQAVEAKEGVVIERETQTLATITIQNYFRMYKRLSGMTGTAETEASEFAHTYKMDVITIPPNRSTRRVDLDDVIYRTVREKYNAVIEEIQRMHDLKLPVLVGTVSVEVSETLSRMLKRQGISHNVLNAKNHFREAEIVREAGRAGMVTIATNMAGRGTDIKLGELVRETRLYQDENDREQEWPGGLQIIGTERHEARRIDRQLRGRAGRQGDPGTSRFFVSLEDNLMRLFGSDRLSKIMSKLGMQEGEPIIHPWVSKAITRAQKKVEEINFERRKKTLEYDNVMNKQREAIYGLRREFLTAEDLSDTLLGVMAEGIAAEFSTKYGGDEKEKAGWDLEGFVEWIQRTVPYADFSSIRDQTHENFDALLEAVMERVTAGYEAKREQLGPELTDSLIRYIAVRSLDEDWQDHLLAMDDLREGIHLRSYAQRDPLVEYTRDATQLFNEMMSQLQKVIFERFFRVQVVSEQPTARRVGRIQYRKDEAETSATTQSAKAGEPERPSYHTVRRDQPKVSPNDPCPCGSGKKHKKCCGSPQARQRQRTIAAAEARALEHEPGPGEPPRE